MDFIPRENIWVEEKQTLADLVGYIITLSMYQNFCQANGEEAGQELLDQFITKCFIQPIYIYYKSRKFPNDCGIFF